MNRYIISDYAALLDVCDLYPHILFTESDEFLLQLLWRDWFRGYELDNWLYPAMYEFVSGRQALLTHQQNEINGWVGIGINAEQTYLSYYELCCGPHHKQL